MFDSFQMVTILDALAFMTNAHPLIKNLRGMKNQAEYFDNFYDFHDQLFNAIVSFPEPPHELYGSQIEMARIAVKYSLHHINDYVKSCSSSHDSDKRIRLILAHHLRATDIALRKVN